MRCPNCQTENPNNATQCSSCGAKLQNTENLASGLNTVTGGSIALGRKAREARVHEVVDPSAIISDRTYNGVICAVLLWGLLVNYLLCRYVGVYTNIFPNMSPIAFLIGYVVVAIIGLTVTAKAQSPLISFIGYNLVVLPLGIVVSTLVESYGGIDSNVVTLAFLYTLLIGVAMLATVLVFPKLFEKIGGALAVVLFGLIVCEIVLLLFHVQQEVTGWIAAGLFSLYLGYDIYRSQQYPKTFKNAVASALDIYLDLTNLFIRLLQIMGKKND